MFHDLNSASHSRRLLSVAAIAATAATVVFSLGRHHQISEPASLAASSVPMLSGWTHDDSLPNTAETLSHETLGVEEPASTF